MIEIRVAPAGGRMGFRQTRKKRQSRECLRGGSVTYIVFIDPRFADAGGLQIDDPRIDLAQFLVTEIPLVHLAGTEIFADSVGVAYHPPQQIAAFGVIEVERDPVLARV